MSPLKQLLDDLADIRRPDRTAQPSRTATVHTLTPHPSDWHMGRPANYMVATDRESARAASLAANSLTFACGKTVSLQDGRANPCHCKTCKRIAADDAEIMRRGLRQLELPARICDICKGGPFAPGSQHRCAPPALRLPHDEAARKFQAAGERVALAELGVKTEEQP